METGRSATERSVLTYYGKSGDRPLVKSAEIDEVWYGGWDKKNMAFAGIHFYSYQRDPGNPNYAGASSVGKDAMAIIGTQENFLFEDCKIGWYKYNLVFQGSTGNVQKKHGDETMHCAQCMGC